MKPLSARKCDPVWGSGRTETTRTDVRVAGCARTSRFGGERRTRQRLVSRGTAAEPGPEQHQAVRRQRPLGPRRQRVGRRGPAVGAPAPPSGAGGTAAARAAWPQLLQPRPDRRRAARPARRRRRRPPGQHVRAPRRQPQPAQPRAAPGRACRRTLHERRQRLDLVQARCVPRNAISQVDPVGLDEPHPLVVADGLRAQPASARRSSRPPRRRRRGAR